MRGSQQSSNFLRWKMKPKIVISSWLQKQVNLHRLAWKNTHLNSIKTHEQNNKNQIWDECCTVQVGVGLIPTPLVCIKYWTLRPPNASIRVCVGMWMSGPFLWGFDIFLVYYTFSTYSSSRMFIVIKEISVLPSHPNMLTSGSKRKTGVKMLTLRLQNVESNNHCVMPSFIVCSL